ncbi:MAG: L-glutamate gamma-semialdehyde dehydrogenase [Rhodothermaceae bacterium]|nr:L-glutamate gamma-semialdehyde dehydrogenase [Rhodothermaceae bacterium]
MNNAIARIPTPENEPVRAYEPGSNERASIKNRLKELKATEVEVPAIIGGEYIYTGRTEEINPPHEHSHKLGVFHKCEKAEAERAIVSCLDARHDWSRMHWTDRAAIFLKAAQLLSESWRDTLNGATMLGQSKNIYQAEIDSACELIDFLRFNVHYMQQIYEDQPISSNGTWNQVQYRGLEGFVLAVTPFNFTAIQGNLPTAPALMGNTVIWKPSSTAIYSAFYIYKLLEQAGLPPGVINMLPGDGPPIGNPIMASEHFSGLHFTGSTRTFQSMWHLIGTNIQNYNGYPRIVGETGGKDFIVAHPSAEPITVATAIVRGGYEYQGQKCSAASRVYLPKSLWPVIKQKTIEQLETIKIGIVEDFGNFVNAVIDQKSYDKIKSYIDQASQDPEAQIIYGGKCNDQEGYFIEPTLILTTNPHYRTMEEELFGPVVTIYIYDDNKYTEILDTINQTSPYALTGAVFASDRGVIVKTREHLIDAAGNFYINDKPTGAVVGQQPFGGARASGTNDKAGSYLNLIRWVSARTIKENLNPPVNYRYPFLHSD